MSSKLLDKLKKSDIQTPEALAEQIIQVVNGIRFGSVELVIHEGRVVQIERCEKVRLERQSNTGEG